MIKKWVLHLNSEDAKRIASEFNIHPALASVLLQRGLNQSSDISRFLNPSLDSLESPFAYTDMKKAVERIRAAIARHEKILVYGDYDVDGITGSAILYPVLKKMGADTEAYIPHRIDEGYGLNQEALKKLLRKGFKLVITVDNGITGFNEVQFLNSKGVDTIIVDHHLPKAKLPSAFAIVSASLDGKGDPDLAACGLAFKLAWALSGDLEAVKDSLDLVVIGTVADIAPVNGDNRVLLQFGMPVLAKTRRIGLRALMNNAGISHSRISYRDIAFGLGPRINASGRMGSPENAFKLLVTVNDTEAENLAQILEEGNRERQRVEASAFEEALEIIEMDSGAESNPVIVLDSPHWHEGVLGIVASRVVERYHKPSIVISRKNGVGKGSGRSIPSFSLFDGVLRCEDLLMSFGGHAQACGLTIREENIPFFRKQLNEKILQDRTALESVPELPVDAEISLKEVGLSFLQDLGRLEPFGPGNRRPVFLSRGVRLKSPVKKRGQDTLQCWITDEEESVTCELIGFRKFDRWNASKTKGPFDVVHQPSLKDFNGIVSIQLELEDWRPLQPSSSSA